MSLANMKDVAAKANVSVSTVSHVINGTRFVSEEVKNRVREAIDRKSTRLNSSH